MNKLHILLFAFALTCIAGCEKLLIEPSVENTNQGIFDYTWEYTQQHYCCFDMKQIDWNTVYDAYANRVNEDIGEDSLAQIIHEMLSLLEDEYVAISGAFGEWSYETDNSMFPANLDASVVSNNYKPSDYEYEHIRLPGNIAYMNQFSRTSITSLGIVAREENNYEGLILDFRNWNSKHHTIECSSLFDCEYDLSNFIMIPENTLIGTKRLRIGEGEYDYRDTDLTVGDGITEFLETFPIVVLCNRETYGGSNRTVYALSHLPNVTLVGDRTGGGNMDVRTTILPNGWLLHVPALTLFDLEGGLISEGFDPDIFVNDDPVTTDKDEIIEAALDLLN